MRPFPALVTISLLAALPCAAADPGVLIAPFPPGTVRPEVGAKLDSGLRAAAGKLPGVDVQAKAQTEQALAAMQEMGLSCNPDETRCLVQLGALASVERVISTQAVPEGEGLRVTLRLIDVRGENEIRRIDGRVERDAIDAGLRGLATGLLLPSRYRGRLALEIEPAGARVLVDGEVKGAAPLSSPLALRAGPRTVRVEKEGFAPNEQVIVVPFEGQANVSVTLSPGDDDGSTFAGRTRVLVLDLLVQGADLPNPRTLASLVAVELARDPGLDVLSGTDVDQLIASQEAGMEIDCQDTGCLSDLAGAFDVPYIVHGDVGTVGSVLVVHLDVFDAERVETVARTSVENTDRDQLPDELKEASRRLLNEARAARPEISKGELPPSDAAGPAGGDGGIEMTPILAWSLIGTGAIVGAVAGSVMTIFGVEFIDTQARLFAAAERVAAEEVPPTHESVTDALARADRFESGVGPILLPVSIGVTAIAVGALGTGAALLLLSGEDEAE